MFQGKSCQGTETIFLVLIIAIFHDTKVRACTYNTKSNLYFLYCTECISVFIIYILRPV
jgi:hypothetical protein